MTRRKPSSPKRRKGRKKGGLFSLLGNTLLKGGLAGFFVKTLVFVSISAIALLIIGILSGRAKKLSCFVVHTPAVRCISRPSWLASSDRLTAEVVGGIQEACSSYPSRSIFDDTFERAFAGASARFSPWIESLESFQRVYPSQYRVKFRLRRPVALFVDQGRSYFIDKSGVVISSVVQLDKGRIKAAVPVITGFGDVVSLSNGEAAPNRRLVEGAAVAREAELIQNMGELASSISLREIDVSGYGRGLADDVTLITDRSVRILWGRSSLNSRFSGIDPTPQKKASNLYQLLKERKGLSGISVVNLALHEPTCITGDC